jgi:hypothetical protein
LLNGNQIRTIYTAPDCYGPGEVNLKMEQYRGFWIHRHAGGIFVRANFSMVPKREHSLRSTGGFSSRDDSFSTLEEKAIAEWFGLEIARLAVDSCYRDLAIARYERKKDS